jgi:hypothetical protein
VCKIADYGLRLIKVNQKKDLETGNHAAFASMLIVKFAIKSFGSQDLPPLKISKAFIQILASEGDLYPLKSLRSFTKELREQGKQHIYIDIHLKLY